jgi:hypothetical protein
MTRPELQPISLTLLLSFCITQSAYAGDFIDLSKQVPKSHDICAAVKTLRDEGREAEIGAHALPEITVTSESNPRGLMSPTAWAEATTGDYGMTHFLTNDHGSTTSFDVARIGLVETGPKAWVFSTSVGSLNNPFLWVFTSTPDGSKPAHLVAQIGIEGSGHFDTYFVRFADKPYAVEKFGGEKGPSWDVMQLDPAKSICSFSPP